MFVGFWIPAEWKAFQESHPVFVEKIPLLFETSHKFFRRKVPASAPYADKAVFHLGMLCFEDFKEILLLCANGFGIGGQKTLRGLYEKTITADYLSTHPDEAKKFVAYTWVYMKRDLYHAKNEYERETMDPEFIAHVMKEYDRVKKDFLKPGTTKPRMSWTELSVKAMGKKAKSTMANWYYSCYFLPTQQIHSTISSYFFKIKGSRRIRRYVLLYGAAKRRGNPCCQKFASLNAKRTPAPRRAFRLGHGRRVNGTR